MADVPRSIEEIEAIMDQRTEDDMPIYYTPQVCWISLEEDQTTVSLNKWG